MKGNCVAVLMLRSIIIEVSFEIVLGLVIKIKPKKQVKLSSTLWISIVDQDESTTTA